MTADEYVERVVAAATHEEAYAVTREALAASRDGRISVAEWNAIWLAYDRRCQPWRHEKRMVWTGD